MLMMRRVEEAEQVRARITDLSVEAVASGQQARRAQHEQRVSMEAAQAEAARLAEVQRNRLATHEERFALNEAAVRRQLELALGEARREQAAVVMASQEAAEVAHARAGLEEREVALRLERDQVRAVGSAELVVGRQGLVGAEARAAVVNEARQAFDHLRRQLAAENEARIAQTREF